MKYTVNWFENAQNEVIGGSEVIFEKLKKTGGDWNHVSYNLAGAVQNLRPLGFYGLGFAEVEGGCIIGEYLKKLEALEKPELFVINSMVNAWHKFNTPTITLFQDCHAAGAQALANYYDPYQQNRIGIIFNKMQELSGHNSLKNVAVSNFCRDSICKNTDLRAIDFEVIEHGINTELFKPMTDKDKEEARKTIIPYVPSKTPVATYIGRFHPQKGWHIVSQLIKKHPEIHWIVSFMAPINHLPQSKNVTILPPISQTALQAIYGISDVFVLPSACESFGLSSMEAIACNKPIITTKTGVWYDKQPEEVGFFCDWTYESFDAALKKFMLCKYPFEPRDWLLKNKYTEERWIDDWKRLIKSVTG